MNLKPLYDNKIFINYNMLYISGYINNCIANTLNMFLICFKNINNIFDYKNNEKYKKNSDFYNFDNLSKLEEVIIYDKPKKRSKSESQLEFKHDYYELKQNEKNNDSEWDILH